MELAEELSTLQSSAENQLQDLDTEEKTKNALLLPFFDALGYNPFNVLEVEPEHAVGRDGDVTKIDYAINVDGAPAILFDCKEAKSDLGAVSDDPIFQHFGDSESALFIRTNGLNYQFFADFGMGGDIDSRPFLDFDLLDHEPEQVKFLERLTKHRFDTQKVLSAAFELKYTRLLQAYFIQQREDLDTHFVRFLAAQVCEGEVSKETLKRFRPVVQELLQQFEMGNAKSQDSDPVQFPETETRTEPESINTEGETETAAQNRDGNSEENGFSEDGLEDDGLQGGDNIAKEFADKIVGDS